MNMRKSSAFTMMEIMIVLFIMGIILSFVGPKMAQYWAKADETEAKLKISNIKSALNDYYMEFGTVPSVKEGLRALVENPRPNDDRYKKAEREGKWPFVPKGEEGIVDKAGVDFVYVCPPSQKNRDKFKFFEIHWIGKGTEEEPNIVDGV